MICIFSVIVSRKWLFQLDADGSTCNAIKDQDALYGLSLKARYQPMAGEPFFSNLLTLSEVTQECPFDVFIPIDSDYIAYGLSLSTACPILSLGKLVFPNMNHVIHIIGSNPDCFQDDFLGVPDPALVVHSNLNLKNDRLHMGQFLELLQSEGDDMTVVFGRTEGNFIALLHQVNVTIFDSSFTASARIENSVLTISSNTTIFQYPANVHISALVNESEWEELSFLVRGDMLPTGNSFLERVNSTIVSKLRQAAESGIAREAAAQMSQDQALERLTKVSSQYNQSVIAVQEANQAYNRALLELNTTMTGLLETQKVFDNKTAQLRALEEKLSMLCIEKFCESVCMEGETCKNCSRPTFIEKTGQCPVTVNETRTIRIPPFFEQRTTWEWKTVCRTESNKACFEDECPVGQRNMCRGKCVPVFTSQVPVYHWKEVEEEVQRFKSCPIKIFNSSIPDICCEINECKVFAPTNSCITMNAVCRQSRDLALKNVGEARKDIAKPFQDLQEAHKNLSLAESAVASAELKLQVAEQKQNQLLSTLDRIETATQDATEANAKTLQQIEPLIQVNKLVTKNGGNFTKLININSIKFDAVLVSQSPRDLVVDIAYETPYNNHTYVESFIYRQLLSTENFEQIADRIVERSFTIDATQNELLGERVKRQMMRESTNRQIFDS